MGVNSLTLLHSERPKLYTILAFLNAIRLQKEFAPEEQIFSFRSSSHFGKALPSGKANRKSQEFSPFKM